MPKLKGGKNKKKRNVLQVTVPRSSNRSPAKDAKAESSTKAKDQGSGNISSSDHTSDQNSLETRSRRTPKPRKIVDISSPPPKLRSPRAAASSNTKGGGKKTKRGGSAKKKTAAKGSTKGGKNAATSRGTAAKGKRKRPPPKKAAKPAKQPKQEPDGSDSGEDIPLHNLGKNQVEVRQRQALRPSKRPKLEEEDLHEELVTLPPESEEEEEEVDEEEDEVDDSLFFGLPPEKPLDEQDGLREPETYSCTHCREKFKKEDLPEHLSQCPDRYVQCRECGKVLSNLQTLERHHKRFHLKIREVPCTLCEKMFIDEAAARKHLKTVHFKVKNFHCPHCDKAFSQRNKLTYHVRTHSGEKPYSCTECGRSFSLLWNLKTHMRTHTGEKPYACDICGRQFTQKQNMTSHMTTHRKPKPDRRTFPGLAGNDLNGSSTSYGYDSSPRSTGSTVKVQSSTSKPYTFTNMLKTNYISTSKPVLQGIGQQYLLDDVASVVDVPGRQDSQTKITTQTSLGAATAQISQNLINQQVLAQHGQSQINVETGLGLLSAVARKGDESNVQVDGIVSLEQNQQSSTGNPSLDQVVEVFLQSNVNESTGDHFIPSMVGAETMVSTSEIEQDAAAAVDNTDHQALLATEHVAGEKLADGESGSPNKQMVGQITAQTVIPVDQANLAGLANILQNPEILAAINAASSSNKFIVIGPVGMFSGQQTATTASSTVAASTITEHVPQSYPDEISNTAGDTTEPATVQEAETTEISEAMKTDESAPVNSEVLPEQPVNSEVLPEHPVEVPESDTQASTVESDKEQMVVQSETDIDHQYDQESVPKPDSTEAGGEEETITSSGNVIQISSSFTKAIAGMSSRITTNNISDVTAALIHEIQGQIQLQGTKGPLPADSSTEENNSFTVTDANSVSSLPAEVEPKLSNTDESVSGNTCDELPPSNQDTVANANGNIVLPSGGMGATVEMCAQNLSAMDSDEFKLPAGSEVTQVNPTVNEEAVSTEAQVYAASSTADTLSCTSNIVVSSTEEVSEEQNESYVTVTSDHVLQGDLMQHTVSSTNADGNTIYISQIPGIVNEQVSTEGVTNEFSEQAETSETTVVVNPTIVQSLLNNINIPTKSVNDAGDFPVIDIATGNYIGTSSLLNSVPVTGTGLEVTIEPEQLVSTATCAESSSNQVLVSANNELSDTQLTQTDEETRPQINTSEGTTHVLTENIPAQGNNLEGGAAVVQSST